jgi:DNA-binding NtrC family response regulator
VQHKVLVVDDEAGVRFGIRDFLQQRGFEVCEADDCSTAREVFQAEHPDVAVIDYALPDGNALELLAPLRESDPLVSLIILTAHGTIDLAVRAVKLGAEQVLTKPIELEALGVMLDRLVDTRRIRHKQIAGASGLARDTLDPFLGSSRLIRRLAVEAARVARADCPVLILGETGTGKGLITGWLHRHSPRADEPFVDLNCASLSKELLESELFGHEKGAFTGALASKPGLMEVARHGTIFLDEIGDLDLDVQPKLLKAIEDKRFRRLGEVRDRRVDVRLLAATHADLQQLVEERRFRQDLYYRISMVPLVVPPLRERREDIRPLARELLRRIPARTGRAVELTDAAKLALMDYDWPGNIRELRNVLERAVLLTDGPCIDSSDLRFQAAGLLPGSTGEALLTLADLERRHIERAIAAEAGHVERAARRLGIPRSSLYARLKRYRARSSRS